MAWCKILAFCVAVLASVHGQGPTVEVTLDKTVVDVGDTVTFTCTVTTDTFGSAFLRWQRLVETDTDGLLKFNMATNQFFETAFTKLGRFSSSMTTTDNHWISKIVITGVTTEDTGNYSCSFPSAEIADTIYLTVAKDVADVEMSYVNGSVETQVSTGMEVTFKKGDTLTVKCSVRGVNPKPELTITIGEEVLMGQPQERRNLRLVQRNVGAIDESYDVDKEVSTVVTYEHTGKLVRCRAKLPGNGRISKEKSFAIIMEGIPPVIECKDSWQAMYAVTDQRIVCSVTARPPVTEAYVMFYMNNNQERQNLVTIRSGEEEGSKKVYLDTTGAMSNVTLHFDRVFLQDYRNYTFIVDNGVGRAEKMVAFVEAPHSEVNDDGASWRVSALMLILTLTMSVLHQL